MNDPVENNKNISFRFALNYFLLLAIYGISSPYLQLMVRRLGYSPAAVGIFLGFFELVGITGPIFLAQKADRFGRLKPFLFASGMMAIVGLALLAPFRIPLVTLISLTFLSLGLKTPIPLLDTSLLRAIEKSAELGKKQPNYGLLRGIGSMGFVVVAIVVQSIPGFDASSVGTIALAQGILILFFLAGLFVLPEVGHTAPRKEKIAFSFQWLDSTFILGLAVIALGRLAMASVGSFFSMYLTEELHWHAVGAMWALSATVEIPFIMLSWKFIRRKSPMMAVAIASGAIVVRLLMYAIVPTPAGAIMGQLLHSLCYGLFQPAAIAFVNLKTPPAERATGLAIYMGLGIGLPSFLGSALGGTIVEALGYRWLFASYALFAVASLVLFWRHREELTRVR